MEIVNSYQPIFYLNQGMLPFQTIYWQVYPEQDNFIYSGRESSFSFCHPEQMNQLETVNESLKVEKCLTVDHLED